MMGIEPLIQLLVDLFQFLDGGRPTLHIAYAEIEFGGEQSESSTVVVE